MAVGLWGAQLGLPALWVLPVAFPLVMALGGVAGITGLPLPPVEWGVALSVIVLGSLIALDRRPRLALAGLVVAFFAVFHGYAHGAELPAQAGPLAYSAGFVVATGTLHLVGIGLGPLLHALGVAFAPLPLAGALLALVERVRGFWLEVAVRIAGSWIATIALLAGALALAGR